MKSHEERVLKLSQHAKQFSELPDATQDEKIMESDINAFLAKWTGLMDKLVFCSYLVDFIFVFIDMKLQHKFVKYSMLQ